MTTIASDQTMELVSAANLLAKVGALREQCGRLVQISVTRLPDQLELTYGFDLVGRLANLRLCLPATEPKVPSITSIYWCAFLYENEMHDLFGLHVDGMAVDFHGSLYKTAVKFPFGATKLSPAKSAVVKPVAAVQGLPGSPQAASVLSNPLSSAS